MTPKKLSIVVPALNEEKTIAKVIKEIPRHKITNKGYDLTITVIDNNSTDRTREIAEKNGARVIYEPSRGKGKAICTAFKYFEGDVMFILDGDYTYPATYIPQMLDILETCDVVTGSRLKGQIEDGAMTRINWAGNHLLAFMANVLYGTRITDLCTGFWGFKSGVIKSLKMDANGFDLEANIFSQIARKGFRIKEVPIQYRRRDTPSKLNRFRDGYIIGKTLMVKRFKNND